MIYIDYFFITIGIVALIIDLFIIGYSYKVMRVADYYSLWKKSWIYFIIAIMAITVRRAVELFVPAAFTTYIYPISAISAIFFILFIYNITEVFKSVRHLGEESRFITLLKNLPAGVIIYAEDATIVYANSKALELMNLDNIEGMTDRDLVDKLHFIDSDGSDLLEEDYPINIVLSTGKAFSGRIYGLNHLRKPIWLLVNAYPTSNGEKQVVVVFTDITYLKETEKICRMSEDMYKKAFMYSHDAIVISKISDGTIFSVNRSFSDLSGFTEEDILGKSASDIMLWKNASDRVAYIDKLLENGFVKDFKAYFITKDGNYMHGLVSGSYVTINGEECLLTSVSIVDESRNRRKEDKCMISGTSGTSETPCV